MRRRSFLRWVSLPLVAPALSGFPRKRDRLTRIGLQLYTVRGLMRADVARTLDQVARAGYREVEFAGYFGESPGRIRSLLDALGLTSPSTHVSLEDLTREGSRTFDIAEAIGHHYLVVASLDGGDRRTLDDFRRVAAALDRAGETARGRGLRVGYHNHDFELGRIDGALPYDMLLAETDPELVCFEMDFYWMTRGGGDPVSYFERHPGRFHLCHIKDMDRRGGMADVGSGRIDFQRILRRRSEAGLRHFYVEHDHPRDALASIAASYRHLRHLEL
jgi:sugar phosphate isomerase/epimerase